MAMTFIRKAALIRNNDYILIKHRPCRLGHDGNYNLDGLLYKLWRFRSIKQIRDHDSPHHLKIPYVYYTDYQLIDISADGFVSLLTENCNTKDDLRLPANDHLLNLVRDGFAQGKDLFVTVMSSMGEEQICALI